jgi:hypothetical protein
MVRILMQPSLDKLHGFIAKINVFPISAGQLVAYADKTGAPLDVINFYKRFDSSVVFDNKDDLATSSEQVEILREESSNMPKEEERSPEEY